MTAFLAELSLKVEKYYIG